MSPVLWQAIGYACGISLGILVLAGLVNLLMRRLEQQPESSRVSGTESSSLEAQSAPESSNTSEGSQSA
ncbi:hypothetical protein [Thermostichus vulcanus]|nr:hypothetical protein [Thermostichus vulcanus]